MKGNQMIEPTAEDWIILRVLQEGAMTDSHKFIMSETVSKTLFYLSTKLGLDVVNNMLDQIIDEANDEH